MFTGIVEELGFVAELAPRAAGARLRVRCRKVLQDAGEGASISVNGVCLTVVDPRPDSFAADVSPETLRLTNLGELRPGARVNLERPLAAGSRLSGHIVQGHVDGVAEVVFAEQLGDENWWFTFRVPPELERYLVLKGSVAADGVSLTVAALDGPLVSVAIIPHTWRATTLSARVPGALVNVECDILAKHVEKLIERRDAPERLTAERLRDLGY